MATFDVGQQAYPTKDEIRDQILSDLVFSYATLGLDINVLPGSDHYRRADAFAGPVSIAIANGRLARSALSPLTAQGDDLLELAAVSGVYARPATFATGFVKIYTPISLGGPTIFAAISAGYKCTSATGFQYQTTSANTVSILQTVQIQALVAGEEGNILEGEVLSWDSTSVGNLLPTCIVAAGGISGGADADDVETVRTRLLEKLAAPGVGGNNDYCIQVISNASAAISAAYVYAAVRGPGSLDAAIVRRVGDRTLDEDTVALALGALTSNLNGHSSYIVTTVNPEYVDVIFNTSLPLPQQAGGAGGGWRDADPWPQEITQVTAYNAVTLTATVDSTATPAIGNKIGIWDPDVDNDDGTYGVMREYEVASVGGSAGAWTITVEGGFTVDPSDAYVSAGAYSLTQYARAMQAQFETLGPGEKTDSAYLLPRSRRHPPPDVKGPNAINSRIITAVESQFKEIALEYAARYETGTTTPILGPSIPATTADPPNIVVLKYMAFIADV